MYLLSVADGDSDEDDDNGLATRRNDATMHDDDSDV